MGLFYFLFLQKDKLYEYINTPLSLQRSLHSTKRIYFGRITLERRRDREKSVCVCEREGEPTFYIHRSKQASCKCKRTHTHTLVVVVVKFLPQLSRSASFGPATSSSVTLLLVHDSLLSSSLSDNYNFYY